MRDQRLEWRVQSLGEAKGEGFAKVDFKRRLLFFAQFMKISSPERLSLDPNDHPRDDGQSVLEREEAILNDPIRSFMIAGRSRHSGLGHNFSRALIIIKFSLCTYHG